GSVRYNAQKRSRLGFGDLYWGAECPRAVDRKHDPNRQTAEYHRAASATVRNASTELTPRSIVSTWRFFAASLHTCKRARMRSADPTSAVSSTSASGTAATASSRRPDKN